jgi:hypothetical protein
VSKSNLNERRASSSRINHIVKLKTSQLIIRVRSVNASRVNDEYKRKNLFEYPGHVIYAVSVHYAQQRAGAVNIDFILYFLSTRWQYSSIFIMIYRDFFVPILQDAVLPTISVMAGCRFLSEEKLTLFWNVMIKICHSFHLESMTVIFNKTV